MLDLRNPLRLLDLRIFQQKPGRESLMDIDVDVFTDRPRHQKTPVALVIGG